MIANWYKGRIRLSITDEALLIHAPVEEVRSPTNFVNLKILFHEIRSVSIKGIRNPDVENIFCDSQAKYLKYRTGTKSYLSPYKYVFTLNLTFGKDIRDKSYSSNIRFVDIEVCDGRRILIEFDDPENFCDTLQQQISQKTIQDSEKI